jgi:hypothetical protein
MHFLLMQFQFCTHTHQCASVLPGTLVPTLLPLTSLDWLVCFIDFLVLPCTVSTLWLHL